MLVLQAVCAKQGERVICYAILKIKYRNDTERKTVDVELQEDVDRRVQDQLNRSEVVRVEVFTCVQIHTKEETVKVSVYKAPSTGGGT